MKLSCYETSALVHPHGPKAAFRAEHPSGYLFLWHTGILKSPIVLWEAEENHSFLCREQSCSLFSKDFPLLSAGEAVPLAAPPGQHSATLGLFPWGHPQWHPRAVTVGFSAGLSSCWNVSVLGQGPGHPEGSASPAPEQTTADPMHSQTLLEGFKGNIF